MIVLGIDPGKSGGLSFFETNFGETFVGVEKLPENARALHELIESIQLVEKVTAAYLEKIYLPSGKAGSLAFGAGWGKIIAVLEMLDIETHLVTPQRWMRELGCMTRGDKNVTKNKAQSLFGGIEYDGGKPLPITHWSSDALLIGYYGYNQEVEKWIK